MVAWTMGSRSPRKTPCEGDARLTSAISRTRSSPAGRSAASKSRAGGRPRQAATRSPPGRSALSAATSPRLWATISSRTPMRLVVAAEPGVARRRDVDAGHLLHHVLAQGPRGRQVAYQAPGGDQRLEQRLRGTAVGAH